MASISAQPSTSSGQERELKDTVIEFAELPTTTANTAASGNIIRVPYKQELIHQGIKPTDIVSAHEYLAKYSVKWYDIGLYLRIPKEKLDEIDEDYRRVNRKLIEMIDVWLKNNTNCTWRTLMEAVQNCDHTGTCNTTSIQDSHIVIKTKEQKIIPIENIWEEKEKSLNELQAIFQMLLLLADNMMADCMVDLRSYFGISDDVSDEMIYKKIDLQHAVGLYALTNPIQLKESIQPFEKIIFTLLETQECLEVWSNLLITRVNEIQDELRLHNEDRVSTTMLVTQDSAHHGGKIADLNVNNAFGYLRLLKTNLNSCKESETKYKNQIKNVQLVNHSFRKHISGALPFVVFAVVFHFFTFFFYVGYVVGLLLLYFTPSSIVAIFLLTFVGIYITKKLYDICPNLSVLLKQLLSAYKKLNALALSHMTMAYSISGVLVYIIYSSTVMNWISILVEQQHMKNNLSHLSVGACISILLIVLLARLFDDTSNKKTILAFICLMMILLFYRIYLATSTAWVVIGFYVGTMFHLREFLKLIVTGPVVIGIAIFITAGVVGMQNVSENICKLFRIETDAIDYAAVILALAIEGPCILTFFRWSMLPLKCYYDPTAKSTQLLQESLQRLRSIRKDLQVTSSRLDS